MELLQSVVTNSYPSIITLLKFWLNQLIDICINLLTTYPFNLAICITFVFFIVYRLIDKMFGDKMFRAKYKPLQHKQNLVNDIKLLKKQIRDMQTDIIEMKKKLTSKKQPAVFQPNPHQNLFPTHSPNLEKTNNQLPYELQSQTKQKIKQGRESIKFNDALERSLKQSNEQMLRTLREINQKN